jgi:hypothetical protein
LPFAIAYSPVRPSRDFDWPFFSLQASIHSIGCAIVN